MVYEKSLQKAVPLIEDGLLEASKLLNTENDIIINVSSTEDKFVGDKMGGVIGFTPNGHTFFLSINESTNNWVKFIAGNVAHEFNHAVRLQRVHQKSHTLLNSLVFEGLAQCFEEQITGLTRPWSKAITRVKAQAIWMKLKKRLNVESMDLYNGLFIGQNDKEFPHWSGYTIGYLIVKERLHELGKDWNDIMSMKLEVLMGNENDIMNAKKPK